MLLRLLRETFWRRRQRVAVALLAIVIGSSLATALFAVYADIMDRMSQEMRSYGANILVKPKSDFLDISIAGTTYSPAQEPAYLKEADLPKLKTIFWHNNVLGFAPSLTIETTAGRDLEPVALTGTWFDKEVIIPKGTQVRSTFAQSTTESSDSSFRTGARTVSPWWRLVDGKWPEDGAKGEALLGQSAGRRMGLGVGDVLKVARNGAIREVSVVAFCLRVGRRTTRLSSLWPWRRIWRPPLGRSGGSWSAR